MSGKKRWELGVKRVVRVVIEDVLNVDIESEKNELIYGDSFLEATELSLMYCSRYCLDPSVVFDRLKEF